MGMQLLLNIDLSFFDREYMGEKMTNYLWFAGIILGTILLKKPIASLLTRASSRLADRYSHVRNKVAIRDMLFKPVEQLLQVVLFFLATEQLADLQDSITFHHVIFTKRKVNLNLGDITDHIFLFFFIIFLTQVVTHFIDFIYYVRIGKAKEEKNLARQQLLPLVKEMSKLLAWTSSIFWILGGVFHVNVPALITGLGIGGVAIALAGKETVENFFAAFTILSDKPFQNGDTIKLGEIEGVVERMGFRSTRLRSIDGSAYIIPNQNLVSQNLVNLSNRDKRGMKIIANIKYGVSHEALQEVIEKIKKTLLETPPVKEPIDAIIETFDKETFQLIISYTLPHPLPDEANLNALKREINLKVFEIIGRSAIMGTAVGTS
jgi:MscS family membrane protein